MKRLLALIIVLVGTTIAVAIPPQAPPLPQAPTLPEQAPPIPVEFQVYDPDLPPGSVRFESAKWTQSISVLNSGGYDHDIIKPASVKAMEDTRWHQPGGMHGLKGWKSERYKYLPPGKSVRHWIGNIEVENSIPNGLRKPDGTPDHYRQNNRGILRAYPDGTRFDELLMNTDGRIFEHRVREKVDGKWLSTVYFKDEEARPTGYNGLKVTCSSCHAEAGTGKYNDGLVPGGDTVLSDPLDWSKAGHQSPE